MWISEPPDCYDKRQARMHLPAVQDWDHDLLSFLERHRGNPLHFIYVVNCVTQTRQHGNNRQRVQAKIAVIYALTRLLRAGRVWRIQRKFVMMPGSTQVVVPHLFA